MQTILYADRFAVRSEGIHHRFVDDGRVRAPRCDSVELRLSRIDFCFMTYLRRHISDFKRPKLMTAQIDDAQNVTFFGSRFSPVGWTQQLVNLSVELSLEDTDRAGVRFGYFPRGDAFVVGANRPWLLVRRTPRP
jgi:hypothetical protein